MTNEEFAKEIRGRIGTEIDTTEIDKEIKNYETNLRQVENNKRRLENEIDSLPEDTKYRDRKLKDMNSRLDNLIPVSKCALSLPTFDGALIPVVLRFSFALFQSSMLIIASCSPSTRN